MPTNAESASPESGNDRERRKKPPDPAMAPTPRPSDPKFVDEPVGGKNRKVSKSRMLRHLIEVAREKRRSSRKQRPPEEGLSQEE